MITHKDHRAIFLFSLKWLKNSNLKQEAVTMVQVMLVYKLPPVGEAKDWHAAWVQQCPLLAHSNREGLPSSMSRPSWSAKPPQPFSYLALPTSTSLLQFCLDITHSSPHTWHEVQASSELRNICTWACDAHAISSFSPTQTQIGTSASEGRHWMG